MVKFTASTVLVLLALAATAEAASKQNMEPNDVSSATVHKKKAHNHHNHGHNKVNLRRRSRDLKKEDGKGKNSKKDSKKKDSDKSAGGDSPQNNAGGKDKKETIGNYAAGGGGGDKKGGSGGGGGGGGDKKKGGGGGGGGGGDKKKNEMPITNFADGGIRPSSGTWRPGVYSNNGGTSFGLGGQPQGQPVITNMAGQPNGVLGQTPNKQEFYNPNAPGGVDTVPTNMAARPFTGNINPPAGVVPGQAYTTVHIVNTANNPKPSAANQAATSAALANMQNNNGGTAVTSSPPKTSVISNNAANAMEPVAMATPTVVTTPAVVTNPQTQPLQVSGGTTSTTPVAPVKPMPTVSLDPSLYPANWDIAPTTCVKANKDDWLWKNKSGDGRFDVQQMYARVPQCMYDDHCATGCCVRFHSGFKICQNPNTMSDQMLKWCSGTCSASASVNREDNV